MSARKRSLRLSSLEKSSKAVDLSSSSSKRSKTENYSDNFLSSLPHAVVAQLFPLLTSDDLRRIALTCRGALERVEWFLSSDKALLSALDIRLVSRFEKDPDAKERVVTFPCHHHLTERFKRLGRCFKVVTAVKTQREKIRTIKAAIDKCDAVHEVVCDIRGRQIAYECFGILFHSYCHGWDTKSKTRVFDVVIVKAKLVETALQIVSQPPGTSQWNESNFRDLIVHGILPSLHSDLDEYGFWLWLLLKSWPIVNQAHLLYIISGPVDGALGFVRWLTFPLQESVEDSDLKPLALSLKALQRQSTVTSDDFISLFDELTAFPQEWCFSIVARLLLLSGKRVAETVLMCRALNSRLDELGSWLWNIIQVICMAPRDKARELWRKKKLHWLVSFLKHMSVTSPLLHSSCNRSRLCQMISSDWFYYLADGGSDVGSDSDSDGPLLEDVGKLRFFAQELLEVAITPD